MKDLGPPIWLHPPAKNADGSETVAVFGGEAALKALLGKAPPTKAQLAYLDAVRKAIPYPPKSEESDGVCKPQAPPP